MPAFRRTLATTLVCATASVLAIGTAAPARAADDGRATEMSQLRAHSKAHGRTTQSVRQAQTLLLVKGRDVTGFAATVRRQGGTVRHRFDALGAVSVAVPRDKAGDVSRLLEASGASVSRLATRQLLGAPSDSYYSQQSTYLGQVKAPTAWDTTHGSASVSIAVVDSGLDVTHPDLAGKVVGTYNAATGSATVTDAVGHGTFVAGVAAAATDNAAGVAGAGFDTSLLGVKVDDADGNITEDNEVAGINWAVSHGAKIINLSIGSPEYSALEATAIQQAIAAGITVVAAAGNESTSEPDYPAALPGVISVGATDAAGTGRATFSNYGGNVAVGAPGVGILSTAPVSGSDYFSPTYDSGDGTSFSSPLVAGEVALLAALAPTATPAQLKNAVVSSAHPLAGSGLGAGIVDFVGALSFLPPASAPTLTNPLPAQLVSDDLALAATSSAGKVQFSVDGAAIGAPVTVSSGTAGSTWTSWSVPNGTHVIGAADCNAYGCGSPTTATVSVDNAAPSLTSPAADATVSGAVALSTSTTAPAARFSVDGNALPLVTTSGGTAATTWQSYGLANGQHVLGVAGCDTAGHCGTPTTLSVTLDNAVPEVSSPTAGQVLSGASTLTATASGGGVRFVVDGVARGFDGTAPYSLAFNASTLADGSHAIVVTGCDAAGSTCNGPSSDARSFTAKSLHPALVGATSPISPNNDKRNDTSKVTVRLPDTENVVWSVLTPAGTVFSGPHGLGTLAKGDHAFVWNGRSNGGTAATHGQTYLVAVTTNAKVGTAAVKGYITRGVRIDTAAAVLSKVVGSAKTFYPVADGYADAIALGVTTNEAGTLAVRVLNSRGTTVRAVNIAVAGAGAPKLNWNGRSNGGTLQPAGTYRFTFTFTDRALNVRKIGPYPVTISLKKLVTRSTTLVKNGNQVYARGGSASCAGTSADESDYTYGLWLGNACVPAYDGNQVAAAYYAWTLPAAIKYTGMRFDSLGYSYYAPSILDGVVYNPTTDGFDQITPHSVGRAEVWTTLVRPTVGHISGRTLKTAMGVEADSSGAADYDIKQVRLVVGYQVLA